MHRLSILPQVPADHKLISFKLTIMAFSAEPSQIHALYLAKSMGPLLYDRCSHALLQLHIRFIHRSSSFKESALVCITLLNIVSLKDYAEILHRDPVTISGYKDTVVAVIFIQKFRIMCRKNQRAAIFIQLSSHHMTLNDSCIILKYQILMRTVVKKPTQTSYIHSLIVDAETSYNILFS